MSNSFCWVVGFLPVQHLRQLRWIIELDKNLASGRFFFCVSVWNLEIEASAAALLLLSLWTSFNKLFENLNVNYLPLMSRSKSNCLKLVGDYCKAAQEKWTAQNNSARLYHCCPLITHKSVIKSLVLKSWICLAPYYCMISNDTLGLQSTWFIKQSKALM